MGGKREVTFRDTGCLQEDSIMTPGSQLEAGQERSQQEGLGIHKEVTSQVPRATQSPREKMQQQIHLKVKFKNSSELLVFHFHRASEKKNRESPSYPAVGTG